MRNNFSRLGPLLGLVGVLLVMWGSLAPKAQASTSDVLNFQARLLNAAGAVVPDGYYNVEFKIYDASSSSGSSQGSCTGDSHCQWVETYTGANKVRVVDGYLTANLGSITAFPSTMPWDQQLWLTMNIGGTGTPGWDGEMSPRIQLTSVPYAFRSASLSRTIGSFTGTLNFSTMTANRDILLPDEGGTVCLENSNNCGFLTSGGGGGSFILNGTSLQTPANFHIQSAGASDIGGIIQAASGAIADIFQLQDGNGVPVAAFGANGKVTLKTTVNSTGALSVADSNNNFVLDVDTVNSRVGVGTGSPSNTFSVSPAIYNAGTASMSGSTITGVGTSWTSSVAAGMEFIFANGDKYTVSSVNSDTQITASASGTESNQGYAVHNQAFYVTASGSAALRSSTNSATAFQIQNATGSGLFVADTLNGKVGIGLSPSNSGATLQVSGLVDATSGFATNGTSGAGLTCNAGQIVVSQTVSGGIVTGGTCTSPSSGGLTPTFQAVYDASVTSPQITLDNSPGAGGLVIQDAVTPVGGDLLSVEENSVNGSTKYLEVTTSGVAVGGSITATGTYNTNTFNSNTLTFGSASTASIDVSSGQNLNIGTTNANNITIGKASGTNTTTINAGSGGIGLNGSTTIGSGSNFTVTSGTSSLNGAVTVKVDNSSAFQVQNSSNTGVLAVDTSTGEEQVLLGTAGAGGLNGKLSFAYGGSTGFISLVPLNPTSTSYSLSLPAEDG
ncbi:MAG TPA: hypothetical protein VFP35_01105, partial [Candidatus Saccharimonadales bacterium]|nr:hypothetical protein [Candidatus Saccharimonadales bacterium]